MLPLDAKAATWGFSGKDAADHYGVTGNRTTALGRGPPPPGLPPKPPGPPAAAPPVKTS